jgi:predicted nuclease of predicted toxin-antitoxin system
MRFLIDADLPRSLAQIVRQHGHEAIDVRDIGLGSAKDPHIIHHAQMEGLCFITGDYDFADIRNYPPERYSGLIVLNLPRTTTARYINQLLDSFLQQTELLDQLPGRLAIVEPGRIRIRETQ